MQKHNALISVLLTFCVVISLALSGCKKDENKNTSSADTPGTSSAVESDISSAPAENTRPEKVTKVYKTDFAYSEKASEKCKYTDPQNGNTVPYRLLLPEGYTASKKYPVLLFLHGAGEQGKENTRQLANITAMFKNNGDFISQCIFVCPQTNNWWYLDSAADGDGGGTLTSAYHLLEEIMQKYSCDKNRIYLTGLSMGGYGTWEMLGRYGSTFAAAIPLCGLISDFPGEVYKDIPIKIYHGTFDKTVPYAASQAMYDKIIAAGGKKAELTLLPEYDHNVWDYVYGNREIFSWLFAQNKASNPTMKYEAVPYFRVEDKSGKVLITEANIVSQYFHRASPDNESMDCEIWLNKEGKEALAKAYSGNKGEFSVYFLNNKIYTFTATAPATDERFIISGVFNINNYTAYSDWLSLGIKAAKAKK